MVANWIPRMFPLGYPLFDLPASIIALRQEQLTM